MMEYDDDDDDDAILSTSQTTMQVYLTDAGNSPSTQKPINNPPPSLRGAELKHSAKRKKRKRSEKGGEKREWRRRGISEGTRRDCGAPP